MEEQGMSTELSEPTLEKLLDYYGNFVQDSRIHGMIDAAGNAAGLSIRNLRDDELLDIAAAGDLNQSRKPQAEKDGSGK
jgi:hypothetical protein